MLPKEEEEECENEGYHGKKKECENDGTASMELNQCCEPLHQGQVQQAGNWKASQQTAWTVNASRRQKRARDWRLAG